MDNAISRKNSLFVYNGAMHNKILYFLSFLLLVLIVISGFYFNKQDKALESNLASQADKISLLEQDLASTSLALQYTIEQTNTSLSDALAEQKKSISKKLGNVEDQVDDLSGSLGTLEKLAKTDPELLAKYSKVFFLNENYVPERLSEIPLKYQYSENKQLLINSDVLPHLASMLKAASSSKVSLYVSSAYRSFAEQKALKSTYSVVYGAGTANTFSADQGYSEHQLGTTVDFITSGLGGVLEKFEGTDAHAWMLKNAYKYGFVLSYPKNNAYYVYEPWHWRFVGTELAKYLHDSGKSFYDLDQREIDKYLVNIFD